MRLGTALVATLVSVGVLVGCEKPAGMHLVVHDPTGTAANVHLYVAYEPCDGCTGVTALGMNRELPGEVLFLDGARDADTSETIASVDAGRAVFVLYPKPDETETWIAKVAFIAYDQDGVIVAAGTFSPDRAISDDSVAFRIDLEPASPAVLPSNDATPDQRIYAWRAPNAPEGSAPCFAFEHTHGTQTVERSWFVPPNDTDCDGLADECREYVWEASGPVGVAASWMNRGCSRSTDGSIAEGDRTCKVGAKIGCLDPDITMPTPECTPFDGPEFCLPIELCEQDPCLQDPKNCVVTVESTQVVCEFPSGGAGSPCDGMPPGSLVNARAFILLADGTEINGCESALLAQPGNPSMLASAIAFQAGPQLRISDDQSLTDCKFAIAFEGGVIEQGMVNTTFIDITMAGDRHIVMPIRFRRSPSLNCNNTSPLTCTIQLSPEDQQGFQRCVP